MFIISFNPRDIHWISYFNLKFFVWEILSKFLKIAQFISVRAGTGVLFSVLLSSCHNYCGRHHHLLEILLFVCLFVCFEGEFIPLSLYQPVTLLRGKLILEQFGFFVCLFCFVLFFGQMLLLFLILATHYILEGTKVHASCAKWPWMQKNPQVCLSSQIC